MSNVRKKILIVDDSELNRSLLADMLSDDFEILEAENGAEAVSLLHEHELEISLMLLDIVMPQMDGFEVLTVMNKKGWIKSTPVIMISAETGGSYIDRAYDLGAIDFISRPFDERTVKHRVACNFMLSLRNQEMAALLSEQLYQKEKDNKLMIEILSHIVEFRNGESGMHVLHVNLFTKMILEELVRHTKRYNLSDEDIRLITIASSLHDIGKISVPTEILNKPGRFTPEEFEIMKRHTVEGAKMLDDIPFRKNEELIKISYQICRWHHERYDGKGYPDGLVGDDIPISAQAVALADVYDALTSVRCYKAAYTPDEAVRMILNGECGCFNPLLLECLKELMPRLKVELNVESMAIHAEKEIRDNVKQILRGNNSDISVRTIKLLEKERQKFKYLSDISGEITFEYTAMPEMLLLSEQGAQEFGIPLKILNPSHDKQWNAIFAQEDFSEFMQAIRRSSKNDAVVSDKYLLNVGGRSQWYKVMAKTLWNDTEIPEFEGAIGKIVNINDETEALRILEMKADHDAMTGLLNHNAARKRIAQLLAEANGKTYALVFFDLVDFKGANDKYGHIFGDEVIKTLAQRIKTNTRSSDIAARVGGDEFILFMEYKQDVTPLIERIFKKLTENIKQFKVGVSMGVARAVNFTGDYETLLNMADTAMYHVKYDVKNGYCFYDESMGISPSPKKNKED